MLNTVKLQGHRKIDLPCNRSTAEHDCCCRCCPGTVPLSTATTVVAVDPPCFTMLNRLSCVTGSTPPNPAEGGNLSLFAKCCCSGGPEYLLAIKTFVDGTWPRRAAGVGGLPLGAIVRLWAHGLADWFLGLVLM